MINMMNMIREKMNHEITSVTACHMQEEKVKGTFSKTYLIL